VRDDWEMDDDEEEEASRPVDVQNKQIWEDANTKEHHPMPALVISRGTSSTTVTPSLPLNQPPAMRILKRPSPSISPSQSSTNLNPTGETFQEREARYQAARERIFGASPEGSLDNEDKKQNSTPKKATSPTSLLNPATKIVREPRGPTNQSINGEITPENKGFGDLRTKRPPPSTSISSSDIPI